MQLPPPPPAETETLLARLAARPGVQSTLILSRTSGAIVRSSGLLTAADADELASAAIPSNTTTNGNTAKKSGTRNAEEVASLVYTFVQAAGSTVEALNGEGDEAKLLRLRTKRNELVVVVEGAFLLVVVHETAPA
ncbi:hypothetical protein LTR08_001926 [Meristemomyces frigidus]|nr:hypothetical protein LTR08_001926 [Meristemomyces frigidus]